MATIFLTGDSFSDQLRDSSAEQWFNLVADDLGMTIENHSAWGTAQEWSMFWIIENKYRISSEDQIIWVLTHPSRYWFYEDQHQYTQGWQLHGMTSMNPALLRENAVELDHVRIRAGADYATHIQRPALDTQQMYQRLCTLSYLTELHSWRPPLIIYGFEMFVPFVEEFKNIRFSQGNLNAITDIEEVNLPKDYMKGVDPRFNHMCLTNHRLLADRVVDAVANGSELVIDPRDYVGGEFTVDNIRNPQFQESELSVNETRRLLKFLNEGKKPAWFGL